MFETGLATQTLTPDDLARLPQTELAGCRIVSTGHGESGPFRFGGVTLRDLLHALAPTLTPDAVDVVSADGFGARLHLADLSPDDQRPPLLAIRVDGAPLSRAQGLVRLIVPSETDDALKQVKWVARVVVSACSGAGPQVLP
ncbi:MAG: molybdopterin-dependent oxidoreductase [Caldilineaceae bacterium]